jgi:hypothetical protein
MLAEVFGVLHHEPAEKQRERAHWRQAHTLILLKSGIENLALGLREQEIALLHADWQISGRVVRHRMKRGRRNARVGLLGHGQREFRTFGDAVGPALHDALVARAGVRRR